jgi:hypothetical protein
VATLCRFDTETQMAERTKNMIVNDFAAIAASLAEREAEKKPKAEPVKDIEQVYGMYGFAIPDYAPSEMP